MFYRCLPKQVIIISCRYKKFDNITTIGWHSPVNKNPVQIIISLHCKSKSLEMIRKSKNFCVNYIPYDMKKEALFCGSNSGRDIDKFIVGNIKKEKCLHIDCYRISSCVMYQECKVKDIIKLRDHTMVLGEVIHSFVNKIEKPLITKSIKETQHKTVFKFTTVKD